MKIIHFAILIVTMSVLNSTGIAQPAQGRSENRTETRRERSFVLEPSLNRNLDNMTQSAPLELRCRGGNNYSFRSVGSRTHSSGAVMTTLEMGFSPAAQPAGSNSAGLQPGECSFVQRSFYLDEVGQVREPLKVRFETPANAQLKQTQSGSPVDRSSTRAESYPDENSIPDYLRSPDRYWSFYVSNTGQGYFVANAHRHWKRAFETGMRKPGSLIRSVYP